jgi:hypothetical protein
MAAVRFTALLTAVLLLSPLRATPLFDDTSIIDAALEGPLQDLLGDPDSRDQLPFLLHADGTEHAIKVRLRGKSRLRVCDLLPMRLNFKKSEVNGTLFEGQDKLKLVVPCHTSERAEKNLIEEYAIYRIFNLLTPASYRVRLLRLTFSDTARDDDDVRLHAFLLEPAEQMAERLGGRESELPEVSLSWLDADHMALVYVFQYLIANVDWSLVKPHEEKSCCHNGTLVETDADILYVPYDFDLSGFVDAPYAFPPPDLRIDSVTQRRYRGFCTDRDALEQALHTVVSKRQDIASLIDSLPVLSDRNRQSRTSYLDQFFRAAEKEDMLLKRFENRCLD